MYPNDPNSTKMCRNIVVEYIIHYHEYSNLVYIEVIWTVTCIQYTLYLDDTNICTITILYMMYILYINEFLSQI